MKIKVVCEGNLLTSNNGKNGVATINFKQNAVL